MKDDVLAFLAKEKLCVVSSITSDAKPQSALVAFTHSNDLKLLIGTSNTTRKYQSISANPNVSVVIGFSGDANVQYEGIAQEITKNALESLKQEGFEELPGKDKYRQDPTEAWFLITPTWVRFTVHAAEDRVTEMREFV